ncbi:MAG: MopE-related protein [Patescibacteria group bacterium]|jgi:hypothetical protein
MSKYKLFLSLVFIGIGLVGVLYNRGGAYAASSLANRLQGYILLQVESLGEAWYIIPKDQTRVYMPNGSSAYQIMRYLSLGITNADLSKIPVGIEPRFNDQDIDNDGLSDKLEEGLGTDPNKADTDNDSFSDGEELKNNYNPLGASKLTYNTTLVNRLKGYILLQVEKQGQAWYLNPKDGKRYYMQDGDAAYQIMRFLSLGITNKNLDTISISKKTFTVDTTPPISTPNPSTPTTTPPVTPTPTPPGGGGGGGGTTPPAPDYDNDNDGYNATANGGSDCNDNNASIRPNATEICDSVDNNCNNQVDEGNVCTVTPPDHDNDNDGYNAVANGGDDCNDSSASIHPGATEICGNNVDEDCSGADLLCPIIGANCSNGVISSSCFCGGTTYTSGYCCSNVWNPSSCSQTWSAVYNRDFSSGTVTDAYMSAPFGLAPMCTLQNSQFYDDLSNGTDKRMHRLPINLTTLGVESRGEFYVKSDLRINNTNRWCCVVGDGCPGTSQTCPGGIDGAKFFYAFGLDGVSWVVESNPGSPTDMANWHFFDNRMGGTGYNRNFSSSVLANMADGNTHTIVWYFKHNTQTGSTWNSDGVFEFYFDGQRVYRVTDVPYTTASIDGTFNRIDKPVTYFGGGAHLQGPWPYWLDNLQVFRPSSSSVSCDFDQDGYINIGNGCGGNDCNDANATLHPGAIEICSDGVDQDCNNLDLICSTCSQGAITSRCLCGATPYTSGYCCSNVYQSNACSASDTTDPSVPTNLQASVSGTQVALTWVASTDNIATTGYSILRSTTNGSGYQPLATSNTNSYTNTGLSYSTTYYYVVSAYDAAGNTSNNSNQAVAAIASAPPVGSGPSISGLSSATLVDGQSYTISGSGFGAKNQVEPLSYLGYNIENGIVGEDFSASGWVNDDGDGQGALSTIPNSNSVYSNERAHSGGNSLLFDFSQGSWSQIRFDSGAGYDQFYVTTWVRLIKNDSCNPFQWKNWRVSSSPGYSANDEPTTAEIIGDHWWSTDHWGNNGVQCYYNGGTMGGYPTSIAGDAFPFNQWQRIEQYYQRSSLPSTADGLTWIKRIGRSGYLAYVNSFITHDADDGRWRYLRMGQNYGNLPSGCVANFQVYYDDIYVDNTQARIEICNSQNKDSATQCEIQIPHTTWNDGQIQITANRGSFIAGQSAYLYVVDSNGNVNSSGYQISF